MQIFFLNGLWRLLKNGHLPVKLHSSTPPGISMLITWDSCSKSRFYYSAFRVIYNSCCYIFDHFHDYNQGRGGNISTKRGFVLYSVCSLLLVVLHF